MMKTSLYPTQELRRRALAWAVKLRVNPRVIRVQDMRRKWGSCSSAGTVTLLSALLAAVVSPWFLLLTAFVGVNQWLYVVVGACPASCFKAWANLSPTSRTCSARCAC